MSKISSTTSRLYLGFIFIKGSYDEDPNITPKKLSKKLSQPLKKDEDIEPIAMTRGYVQVKNPLVITNAKFGVYSNAISFFDDEKLMIDRINSSICRKHSKDSRLIETDKHMDAKVDGIIIKNNQVSGVFESKCRNLSLM